MILPHLRGVSLLSYRMSCALVTCSLHVRLYGARRRVRFSRRCSQVKPAELAVTGPVFDPARRKDRLRFLIAVTGTDGHRALLSWAEIDPDFADAPVLPAVTMEDRAPARRDARARRGWRRAPGPPRPPWPRHCIGF